MNSQRSLKSQITFRVAAVIFTLWLCAVAIYYFAQKKQLTDLTQSMHQSQSKTLSHFIEKESAILHLLQNSLHYSLSIYNQKDNKDDLEKAWQLLSRQKPDAQLIYYDETFKPILQFGLTHNRSHSLSHIITQPSELSTLTGTYQPKHFFTCEEVCYINRSSSLKLSKTNKQHSFLRLRAPLSSILWDIHESHQLHVGLLEKTARYSFSSKLQLQNKTWYINNSTDNLLFETLSLANKKSNLHSNKPNIVYLKQKKEYWLINTFDIMPDSRILIAKEITTTINQVYFEFYRTTALFLAFTLIPLIFIIYLLQTPIRLLQKITNTLPLIGQGRYEQVRQTLAQLPIGSNVKEITNLVNYLQSTTLDIKTLHNHLSQSLDETSDKLNFIQEIINASNAIFVIYNSQYRILLCNKHASKTLGLQQNELLNAHFIRLFSIKNEQTTSPNDHHFTSSPFQSTLYSSDGHKRLISWSRSVYQQKCDHEYLHICVGVDITERLELEERIRHIANHDELSNLINRRRLNQILRKLIRKQAPFHFLYIDLNYFKVINDTLGHASGDRLLVCFADLMLKMIGGKGIVARTGGDEFAAIVFLDKQKTAELCALLINKCKQISLFGDDEKLLSTKVGLSIGIVAFPEQAKTEKELYAYADAAMYENKAERSSSYHFYNGNERLVQQNKHSKYWMDTLEDALTTQAINTHFQGIHNANDLEPAFYEVLCRVTHNNKVIPANHFIDAIVNKPFIARMDMYILKLAMEKAQLAGRDPSLMVNLSAYTLSVPNIADTILNTVQQVGFSPKRLVIEITEQATITDFKKTTRFIKHLRKQGIRFALDDFGTGYSSLSYLQNLPIQFLKLDKAFLHSSRDDDDNLIFIKNIISLVHSLDIKVIVEGVEDIAQQDIAKQANADYLQGYFLSRPKSVIDTSTPVAHDALVEFS